ncbi:hypothetical protein P3W45_001306 [Vairimorpha bombi]|jgi:hypothetical protein
MDKKFLPVIKVGGRRIIKKSTSSHSKLKEILDSNKGLVSRSSIEDLSIEKSGKVYKYKNNIKLVFDSDNKPVGLLVTGYPDIRNKIVMDIPSNFEKAVYDLNKDIMDKDDEMEEAIGID